MAIERMSASVHSGGGGGAAAAGRRRA
eukprot:SAG25_NODE_10691_length_325_cov_0.911504_1_plen_26_part_10